MHKPPVRAREQTERTVTGNNHGPGTNEDVPTCRQQHITQFGYTYAALPEKKDTTPSPL